MLDLPAIQLLHAALNGAARRHDVIASNLANIDTKGYRAKELDFQNVLRQAMGSSDEAAGLGVQVTDSRHLQPRESSLDYAGAITEQPLGAMRADGNNVDVDREMLALAENGMLYNTIAQLTGSGLKGIIETIKAV
ncbi:MAG: flagellar basal body rod protein FlgB [Candidatus Schekmanbacteria bacterium]|nr:flagellar basal body rod protein FlgB [Candidatus Schekmanbacteria bacterium]